MVSSNQTLTSPSGLPAPVTSDQPSSSPTLFGLHVVIIPAAQAKPESRLQNCNILWMSITSAGERLALQLDSCCSVSLVSKVHADFVASKRPDIKHCALEELISMLVVPGLVKPILFGENHLHATKALVIDHNVRAVAF